MMLLWYLVVRGVGVVGDAVVGFWGAVMQCRDGVECGRVR